MQQNQVLLVIIYLISTRYNLKNCSYLLNAFWELSSTKKNYFNVKGVVITIVNFNLEFLKRQLFWAKMIAENDE